MTREEMIREVNRKRMIDEVKRKRAEAEFGINTDGAAAVDITEQAPPNYPDWESEAAAGLKNAGPKILEGLGKAATTVDQYVGGPIRGMIGESLDMPVKRGKPSAASYFFPALAAGETYPEPPSGKDISARLGMSEEDSISLPLISDPFTREPVRVSPAGVAGGFVEAVTDPTAYFGMGMIDDAGRGIQKGLKETGRSVKNFARERAVKAATGESKANIKKIAKVEGQTPRDVSRAMQNIYKTGDILLEPDPNFGGKPAIGWLSNAEKIGENAAERRNFYGKEIGRVGEVVDRLNPGGVTRERVASEVDKYGRGIPRLGTGDATRNRVFEEGKKIRQHDPRGQMQAEDDLPQYPLTFKEAQDMKGAYKYKPQSPDMIESNQDATNRIKRIIGKEMDRAVTGAQTADPRKRVLSQVGGELDSLKSEIADAYKAGVPANASQEMHDATRQWNRFADQYDRMLDDGPPILSPADAETLGQYPAFKQRYGAYSDAADAGANQAINTLSRRMVSPSSNFLGAQVGQGVANVTNDLRQGGLWGAGAGFVNQQLLERGSALAARSANAISKRILQGGALFEKWRPILTKAAQGGYGAVLTTHHQLMNNDPQYRKLMLDMDQQP